MSSLARITTVALGVLFVYTFVPQRQLVRASAESTDGWRIRVLPNTTAPRIEWQFGTTPMGIIGKTTSKSPRSPELPPSVRRSMQLHLKIWPEPRQARVSFCLFWNQQGAAMVEVTEPTDRLFNERVRDTRCLAEENAPSRTLFSAPSSPDLS